MKNDLTKRSILQSFFICASVTLIFAVSCNKGQSISDQLLFGITGESDDAKTTTEKCSAKVKVELVNTPNIKGVKPYSEQETLSNVILVEDGNQDFEGKIKAGSGEWGPKQRQVCISLNEAFLGEVGFPVNIIGNNQDAGGNPRLKFEPVTLTGAPELPAKLKYVSIDDKPITTKFCYNVTVSAGGYGTGNNSIDTTNPIVLHIGKPIDIDKKGVYRNEDPCDVTFNVEDDQGYGIKVSGMSGVTEEPSDVTPAGKSAVFEVVLRREPTKTVKIYINDLFDSNNVNYKEGKISTPNGLGYLEFVPSKWNVVQKVTVNPKRDYYKDGAAQFVVELKNVISDDPNYNGKKPRNVTVTNLDSDNYGLKITAKGKGTGTYEVCGAACNNGNHLTISGFATDDMGNMGSEYANFSFVLTSKPGPSQKVKLKLTSNSSANDGIISPDTITFDESNWNQSQPVTVKGASNNTNEGNHDYTISTSIETDDSGYKNMVNPKLSILIRSCDNDENNLIQRCEFSDMSMSTLATTEITNRSGVFPLKGGGSQANTWFITQKIPSSSVTFNVSGFDLDEHKNTSPGGSTITIDSSNYNKLISGKQNELRIEGEDDLILECAKIKSYELTMSPAMVEGKSFQVPNISVSNKDDEFALTRILNNKPISSGENVSEDGTKKIKVEIYPNYVPAGEVKITATCLDPEVCQLTSDENGNLGLGQTYSLSFNAGDTGQSVTKTFYVFGVDNDWADGNSFTEVTFNVNPSGFLCNGVNNTYVGISTFGVLNEDNDGIRKLIFESQQSFNGEQSGINAADAVCNSEGRGDSKKPKSTYKALLVGDSDGKGKRFATTDGLGGGQVDWILKPNYHYYWWNPSTDSKQRDRFDRIFIATSSGLIPNEMVKAFPSGSYWTGMDNNMKSSESPNAPPILSGTDLPYNYNCAGWRAKETEATMIRPAAPYYGQIWSGGISKLDDGISSDVSCSSSAKLICIEQ